MKNKSKKSERNVCYIKLPAYIAAFMKRRHGNPMVFGSLSPYTLTLTNHLVCNKMLNYYYTNQSYSEHAYNIMKEQLPINIFEQRSIPKAEDIPQLVPVVIPDDVIALSDNGQDQVVETNKYYQLTELGARDFRRRAAVEFWSTLAAWYTDGPIEMQRLNAGTLPGHVSKKDLLEIFMNHYGIDMDHYEAIYKHFDRNVRDMGIKIEDGLSRTSIRSKIRR